MIEGMANGVGMAMGMDADTYVKDEPCTHTFLIERLSDELEDSEEYYKYAKHAKHHDDQVLANLFLQLSKDELRHFEAVMETVEKTIPNIKTNPLYPLLEDLDKWAEDIEADINAFR